MEGLGQKIQENVPKSVREIFWMTSAIRKICSQCSGLKQPSLHTNGFKTTTPMLWSGWVRTQTSIQESLTWWGLFTADPSEPEHFWRRIGRNYCVHMSKADETYSHWNCCLNINLRWEVLMQLIIVSPFNLIRAQTRFLVDMMYFCMQCNLFSVWKKTGDDWTILSVDTWPLQTLGTVQLFTVY